MKRDLKAIRGHADMAVTFQEKGLDGMLTSLSTLLPPLITPGAPDCPPTHLAKAKWFSPVTIWKIIHIQ